MTLLSLAVPAIIENALQSLVGFIDTLFIAKLGLTEVAAVGVANNMIQIYFAIFLALSTATTIFISRYSGAEQPNTIKFLIVQSLIMSCAAGFILGVLSLIFAEPLLSFMGADSEVTAKGILYFKIVAAPSFLISLMYSLGAILRGQGDTKTPMRVGLMMNIFHIGVEYVLVFGLFFEGFGIIGAAMATVLARCFGAVLLIRSLNQKSLLLNSFAMWKPKLKILKGLIQVGIPTGLERLFMRFGQLIYFGMIIHMGTDIYAAHTLAGNLTIFSTIIGSGLSVATTTLIGKSIGAGELGMAKTYARVCTIVTAVVMTISTFAICITAPYTATAFTANAAILSFITTALVIDTLSQPATGIILSLTAVLQAGGDTKYPMYVTAIGIWAIRTIGVYLLGVRMGLGLTGVWISIAIDNYIRAFILYARYRSFKWMKKLPNSFVHEKGNRTV